MDFCTAKVTIAMTMTVGNGFTRHTTLSGPIKSLFLGF